jgi:hypothetical protein
LSENGVECEFDSFKPNIEDITIGQFLSLDKMEEDVLRFGSLHEAEVSEIDDFVTVTFAASS